MRVVNEGALYSDRSKLSVAFYLMARSIQGRGVFENYGSKTRRMGNREHFMVLATKF